MQFVAVCTLRQNLYFCSLYKMFFQDKERLDGVLEWAEVEQGEGKIPSIQSGSVAAKTHQ